MIRRKDAGGVVLSDGEQMALIKWMVASAILDLVDDVDDEFPALSSSARDAISDDLDLMADAMMLEAYDMAAVDGLSLPALITAVQGKDDGQQARGR